MPGSTPKGGPEGGGPPKRTTFRPPWVKDGPTPLPMPPPPWAAKLNQSKEKPTLKKQNNVSAPQTEQSPETTPVDTEEENQPRPVRKLKPVERRQPPTEAKEKVVPINVVHETTVEKREGPKRTKPVEVNEKVIPVAPPPHPPSQPTKQMIPPPPPPPPMANRIPPPPPPPMASSKPPIDLKPLTPEKAAKLDALRSRPRRRPDWVDMMKEVETGVKLKKVQCNDRSAPILPKAKAKGQFVYDSEKPNAHNLLLKEIQGGVRLKKVKTNDRSKPILDGLRKFRRQMTIEEQIQKSASVADVVAVAAEPDELDDIDKVRDDLQSTKQMLALELRNKEALERENKRLMARLLNLEVELEKEKSSRELEREKGTSVQVRTAEDDKLISKLKEEAAESSKVAKEMEEMYRKSAEELDITRAKLESAWLQNSQLVMELKAKDSHSTSVPLTKQKSSKKIASPAPKVDRKSSSEEEETETEEESESETETEEVDEAALQEKRAARELKLMTSKLRTVKDKRAVAIKEKRALKEQLKRLSKAIEQEKKKYRKLQKEVDKMAHLMKEVDEDEEEEPPPEIEEEEPEEESESESESEESEDEDEESEGELPESAPFDDRIKRFEKRIHRHENRLTTVKKSNYLLKVNIDRRQDDYNRQREQTLALQEDLNAVLAELG